MSSTLPSPAAQLRAVGSVDIPILAVMHGQCFAEAWTATALAEVLAMPGALAVMAQLHEDGAAQPVGFAVARVAADEAELLTLGVVVPSRRRGIGGLLLDTIVRQAVGLGAWRLFLEVAEDNAAARAMYESRGFAAVGRRPDYYRPPGGRPVAALTLRRSLAPAAAAWTWPPF